MSAFSRLQLAAALLEYDNDPDNPTATSRSAQDSAIFSHARRTSRLRRRSGGGDHSQSGTDYLGVTLPSEGGSGSGDQTRRSRASIDALQNPFATEKAEELEDEPQEQEEFEVDLASWGLDSFIPNEKSSKSSKHARIKSKSDIFPNPHSPTFTRVQETSTSKRRANGRTMSMGEFGASGTLLDINALSGSTANARRNSIANPLDLSDVTEHGQFQQIDAITAKPSIHAISSIGRQERDSIPFPSSSPIPEQDDESSSSRPLSRIDVMLQKDTRTNSNATTGILASNGLSSQEPNPFALRPPSPSRMSRFDPKTVAYTRTLSNATKLSTSPRHIVNDGNQNIVPTRPSSQASFLESKPTRVRNVSNASFGTRNMLDNDGQSFLSAEGQYEREERGYSRMELMRPKVLIMPSPLQVVVSAPPLPDRTRDGFQVSTDGPPLPPGARSSRSISAFQPPISYNVSLASNSFTPNPRLSLSASQLLFRNSLMVDGRRDVTYIDIDGDVRRAQEEGEQVQLDIPEEEEPVCKVALDPVVIPVEEEEKKAKPPGKLYGKSLIDDLEARKASIRSKRRVFTGDQRPSMMDREQSKRSSTLIDPATLQPRPTSQQIDSFVSQISQQSLNRRGSKNSKPLLNFDDEGGDLNNGNPESRVPKARSVFGVDTIWERELAKLKEIEANEAIEADRRNRRDEEEREKKANKKRKDKGKEKSLAIHPSADADDGPLRRTSSLPPVLPDIQKATSAVKRGAPPVADESDEDSSSSEIQGPSTRSIIPDAEAHGWVSDDDEEAGPLRTTGVGPRYPKRDHILHQRTQEEDSDEDIPLSMTLERVARKLSAQIKDSDSDEDKPLSTFLDKSKLHSPPVNVDILNLKAVSPSNTHRNTNEEEDDDEPLGIRASRLPPSLPPSNSALGDDDDRPLALHPDQQRRTQYQMLTQQQMLFQAQMRNTMAFGTPSIMGPIFSPFGAPLQTPIMPIMMPPTPFNSNPPVQDTAKFGRVDRWRRDVAVEGQP